MRVSYVSGVTLNRFLSYLVGRKEHVRYGGRCPEKTFVDYGVKQKSILGLILFIMYAADLNCAHSTTGSATTFVRWRYTDCWFVHYIRRQAASRISQIVGSCRPTSVDITTLRNRIEICVADIADWMSSNRIQQNTTKSELMWYSSTCRRHSIPSDHLIVGSDVIVIVLVVTVRGLALYLDTTMSMRRHITQQTSTCIVVLR